MALPPGHPALAEIARSGELGPVLGLKTTRAGWARGVAVLADGWDEQVTVRREGEEPERRPRPGELPLLAELHALVEHLAGGPPPRSSAAEGAAVVQAIVRLRRLAGIS